jgi:hypothetical protein
MIALPATNETVLADAINPALEMLPAKLTSDQARTMLLAIGRQESGFAARRQRNDGPARGFWQFERNGVLGVMHHSTTGAMAFEFIDRCGVEYGSTHVLDALETDDVLAAGIARLYLWTDPRPLPAIGDVTGAWDLYERVWRPGKPSYTRWQSAYGQAVETMEAAV